MMEEMLSHRSGREGIIVGDSIDDEAEMGEHLSILSQDREKIKRYLSEEDREWQVWSTDSHEYGEIVIKSTQYEDDEGSEVPIFKSIGVVPISHHKMVQYCSDPEISGKWGGGKPKEIYRTQRLESGHNYEMFLFETPAVLGGLVGAREFPEIRVWHSEDQASYLIYRTIDHPVMAHTNLASVRGIMYPAGMVFEAIEGKPDHCKLTSIVHVNLGGNLWQYVCNKAIVHEMIVFYKKVAELHGNKELHDL